MAKLMAIFMSEGTNDAGEAIGYVDLFDPDRLETVGAPGFDDTEFMTESSARRLADERGWDFRVA